MAAKPVGCLFPITMHSHYQPIYDQLIVELEKIRNAQPVSTKLWEEWFWTGHRYWKRVKTIFISHKHIDPAYEIDFFKVTKPRFCAQIEFALLVTEALLFVPEHPHKAIDFWKEEKNRLTLFTEKHHTLIHYLEGGHQFDDPIFFLRQHFTAGDHQIYIYNDEGLQTKFDHLVRRYFAFQLFTSFAEQQIIKLQLNSV